MNQTQLPYQPPIPQPAAEQVPTPGQQVHPTLERGFTTLRRAPLRRRTDRGVLGGVCAGIADSTGVSVTAVRVAAVLLALFFGSGVGAYLLAWALLPDERGATHAEEAFRSGRPRSVAVLALGGIALLGVAAWIFESFWPVLIAAAVVAYVVMRKGKGHPSAPVHD